MLDPQPIVMPNTSPSNAKPEKPILLGQFGDWGAYLSLGAKKICFAIARPRYAETSPPNQPRDPSYMFVSTRPGDKVTEEVSVLIGYPFAPNYEASATIGGNTFALYTQENGAWIKNVSEEARMVTAMRAGGTALVRGASSRGMQSTDTYILEGIPRALDRIAQECK